MTDLVTSQLATKQDLINLKMELQTTFFKMISGAVGILGALQIFFHFYK